MFNRKSTIVSVLMIWLPIVVGCLFFFFFFLRMSLFEKTVQVSFDSSVFGSLSYKDLTSLSFNESRVFFFDNNKWNPFLGVNNVHISRHLKKKILHLKAIYVLDRKKFCVLNGRLLTIGDSILGYKIIKISDKEVYLRKSKNEMVVLHVGKNIRF